MPVVKIHVDRTLLPRVEAALDAALLPLRDLLCERFAVPTSFVQLSVIAYRGIADQHAVFTEIAILPKPERTRDRVTAICTEVQALLSAATSTPVAVRCSQLDPATYIVLR